MRRALLFMACGLVAASPARAGTYDVALYRADLDAVLTPAAPIQSHVIDAVRDYATTSDGWTGPRLRAKIGGRHDAGAHATIELVAPGAARFVSSTMEVAVRACSEDAASGWWGGLTLSDGLNQTRFVLLNVPVAAGSCLENVAARATGAVSSARVLRIQLGARAAGTSQRTGTWINVRSVKSSLTDAAPPSVTATAAVSGAVLTVAWRADDLESGPRHVDVTVTGPGGFSSTTAAWNGDAAAPRTGCLTGQWVTGCGTRKSGQARLTIPRLTGDYAVTVAARDGTGNAAATAATVHATFAPVATAAPRLTGAAQVGQALTIAGDQWANGADSVQYAFYRAEVGGLVLIGGPAATPAYTLQRTDYGRTIVGRAVASNAAGTAAADTASLGPVRAQQPGGGSPHLSGLPATVGAELSVLPGTWDNGGAPGQPAVAAVAWYACGQDGCALRSAAPVYTPAAADVGRGIRADVIVANDGGSAAASTPLSAPVVAGRPTAVQAPGIGGDARVGATLTATPGTWDGRGADVRVSTDWLACDAALTACTTAGRGAALQITEALLGRRLRVRETADNGAATASVLSAPTPPVAAADVCVERGPGEVTVCLGDGRITLEAAVAPARIVAGSAVRVHGQLAAYGGTGLPRVVTIALVPPDPYRGYTTTHRVAVNGRGAFALRIHPSLSGRIDVGATVAGAAGGIVLELPGVRVRPRIDAAFTVRPDLAGRVRDLRFSGRVSPHVALDRFRLLLRGELPDGTEVGLICRVSEQPVVHRGRFAGGCRSRGLPRGARFRVTFLAGPGSPLGTASSRWRKARLR
jgi:hypothetical protein